MSSLAPARSSGSVSSPPLSSSLTQIFSMLDTAAEQMMVHKDFPAVLDTCDRGLESLSSMDQEDNRWRCTVWHMCAPRVGHVTERFCVVFPQMCRV